MRHPLKLLTILTVGLFCILYPAVLASQDGSGHVLISPEETTVTIDDTFSIFLAIDTVELVKDFLVDIQVDTNIIRLDSCKRVSTFFTGPSGAFTYWKDTVQYFGENDSAYVYEIQGSIFGPGNFVNGPGDLVRMKYTAVGYGISPVDFRYYEFRDTLVDPQTHMGNIIELEGALDGQVIVCPTDQAIIYAGPNDIGFLSENGQTPDPQIFSVANPCFGDLQWEASESCNWFELNSYSGTAPSDITVSIDISGVNPGLYLDSIAISSLDAANSPQYVRVSLELTQSYLCGDANGDGSINVSDAVYIINYVFIGGAAPEPMASGEVNCDGNVNVSDAVWIINYVFIGGNAPCDVDGDLEPDC
ncbi:MAG TPA: hypothetical protein ENO22_06140 [candidate division Zixibacteria bacterium]|nr:hypothetical protein [candidate division Zixibacteria bacterium]HEQ98904.1 hypothetical protein [candidate division Zixibacteria bacterium]